jgi:phosphoribosylamine--glycine ligase
VFKKKQLNIFGPSSRAARIEGSKSWAYKLMEKYSIPTARSEVFDNYTEARNYLGSQPDGSLVVKADGLAAGKGVFVSDDPKVLQNGLKNMMQNHSYGKSGDRVVLSDRLIGREISVFGFVSGSKVSSLIPACDYKRAFDGDEGQNTGGMGAFSGPNIWDSKLELLIKTTIFEPMAKALVEENCPYFGVLYAGLMITDNGPKVIEFNCRFGDPECQVLMPRMQSDIFNVFMKVLSNDAKELRIRWKPTNTVGVVLVSGGYPGDYELGAEISGLANVSNDITVYHSGTDFSKTGTVVTSGGRVLTVVAESDDLMAAKTKCYQAIENISFTDMRYRSDIGNGTERH